MTYRNGLLVLFVFLAFGSALLSGVALDWSSLAQAESPSARILFELRFPRALFVFTLGAVLACVGGTYQILFHNPLAEPYLLGVSSAACLAMATAEVFAGIAVFSFTSQLMGLGAAAALTLLLVLVAHWGLGNAMERIVLFGLGVNFVLSSLLFILLSYHAQHVGAGSLRWLFGQIPWLGTGEVLRFMGAAVAGLGILLVSGRKLDSLAFGDGVARTLGCIPGRTRLGLTALTSALVAWCVSYAGAIGFVGLVVPHCVRLLLRPPTTRAMLSYSIAVGGSFLLLSDAASRVWPPLEVPIGMVTALLGGPLFLGLLWKR